MSVRRWIGWVGGSALLALVAFAPFRDSNGGRTVLSSPSGAPVGATPGAVEATDGGIATTDGTSGDSLDGGPGGGASPSGRGIASGTSGGTTTDGTATSGGPPNAPAPEVPDLPAPTERELAVLGPLIAAMDTGQRAGTPLVLGIATSIVATGLPGASEVPPEMRPVITAIADLLTTPGTQVNDLTAQNSVQLAQLDRALGELAFANPALNEVIHQTAAVLVAMGRSAEPVAPPGAVFLSDLSILLTYFVVD